MEEIRWNQRTKRKQESEVISFEKRDFLSIHLPLSVNGWTRVIITPSSASKQILTGASITTDDGQHYRLRQSRKNTFDQVLDLNHGLKTLDISGSDLTSVHIELHRSSSFLAAKKIFLAILSDIFRLGIRQRNLRTFFQILIAGDFRSLKERLTERYNQSPLSTDANDGVINPQAWLDRFMSLSSDDHDFIDRSIEQNQFPTFSIVVDASYEIARKKILPSLEKQKLKVQDSCFASNFDEVLNSVAGEWVIFTKGSIEIHEAATFAFGTAINSDPKTKLIIADSCEKSGGAVTGIRANTPWNIDLVLTGEEVGSLIAVHQSVVSGLAKNIDTSTMPTLTAIALFVFEEFGEDTISRLPIVLSTDIEKSTTQSIDRTISRYLSEFHPSAELLEGICKETRRIKWPLPKPEPKVSILIPTKDQAHLLERCLSGLYTNTEYSNFEIVLIDHQSSEHQAQQLLQESGRKENTTVIEFEGEFNFSAMNNLAAELCSGEILCLLNNDVEIVNPSWLSELVSHLSRDSVGVVGPLLRYPDGSVQHAGLNPNLDGLYMHGHKYFPQGHFGYRGRLATVHRVAAVTGACLATSKDLWNDLDGLNESFAVAYNDVDYCLRARQLGYGIVWTPFAELIHHESLSRGYDEHPKERDRLFSEASLFIELWGSTSNDDPAYSPNLTLESTNFSLTDKPRFSPPWRSPISHK